VVLADEPVLHWDIPVVSWYLVEIGEVEMTAVKLVLKNANVITMEPTSPSASLVAVKDDRIIFVGTDGDLESLSGPGTKVIDCRGKALIPGFIDSHCHIFSFLRNQLTVDLSPSVVHSIEDIKAAIHRKAAVTPPGQWINGSDYTEFYLAEKRHPTRWDIDEVAPDHPVIMSHRSLHACVLNSKALELADITNESSEPPGGSIHRDPNTGEPDGLLFDMLGYIRYRVMPSLSDMELEKGAAAVNQHFLSMGITSLQDATVSNEVKRWQTYRRLQERGILKSRVYLMTGMEHLKEFRDAGIIFRSGDDSLRMGGLKIVLGEATGHLHPSQPDLNRYVLDAHREGCQVAIHAVQPATINAALNALEYAISQVPNQDHRHRLEHCAECSPYLFERVRKLGAVISMQPPFLYYSGERYLAEIPADDIRWLYRVKSFLEAGMVVAAGSDTPVVPNNPLVGLCTAVTRQAANGKVLAQEERVSPLQALALYTKNAAYAAFDEKVKGSITPGKLADLVLLSDDPMKVEPARIKEIKVEKTIIGGEVVW
jgi:predicted amidohydrolase YtcJ